MEVKDYILYRWAIDVENLSNYSDATVPDIIKALTGVVFDEEEAGCILAFHQDDTEI